ncbi:unknown [Phascolarctobacterium sp. CAG:266]|nr:unknown [Phascolarctobacterium sp. CAG:266]
MKRVYFWNDDDDVPWYDEDDPNCEDGELNDPFSDGELEGVLCEDLGY